MSRPQINPRLRTKIEKAAELYFNGHSQEEIAQELGLTQGRISQLQSHPVWSETIERLEQIKDRIKADFAQRQAQEYYDELETWVAQSKANSEANFIAYEKIMKILNDSLDVALEEPDKIAATEKLKNTFLLVRAAVALHEQADAALNQRLGIAELSKQLNSKK